MEYSICFFLMMCFCGFKLLFYAINHMIISQVFSYCYCVFPGWKCVAGFFFKGSPVCFERIWS